MKKNKKRIGLILGLTTTAIIGSSIGIGAYFAFKKNDNTLKNDVHINQEWFKNVRETIEKIKAVPSSNLSSKIQWIDNFETKLLNLENNSSLAKDKVPLSNFIKEIKEFIANEIDITIEDYKVDSSSINIISSENLAKINITINKLKELKNINNDLIAINKTIDSFNIEINKYALVKINVINIDFLNKLSSLKEFTVNIKNRLNALQTSKYENELNLLKNSLNNFSNDLNYFSLDEKLNLSSTVLKFVSWHNNKLIILDSFNSIKSLIETEKQENEINDKERIIKEINLLINELSLINAEFEFNDNNVEIREKINLFSSNNNINNENLINLKLEVSNYYHSINELKNNILDVRTSKIKSIKSLIALNDDTINSYNNEIQLFDIPEENINRWKIELSLYNKEFSIIWNSINNYILIDQYKTNKLNALEDKNKALLNSYNELVTIYSELVSLNNRIKNFKFDFNNLVAKFNNNLFKLNEFLIQLKTIETTNFVQEKNDLIIKIEQLIQQYNDFNISNKSYEQNDLIIEFMNVNNIEGLSLELATLIAKINNESHNSNSELSGSFVNYGVNQPLSLEERDLFYTENPQYVKFNELTTDENHIFNSNNDYLTATLNRSFSLLWNFKKIDETKAVLGKQNLNEYTGGTFWVLDYKHIQGNKYKIFLGTNYHVAVDLITGDDYSEYKQPLKNKQVNNMLITVSRGVIDRNNIKNNVNIFLPKKFWPRIFWLAHNYMQDDIVLPNSNLYFSDFAVVEWNIDLDELSEYYNPEIATTASSIITEKRRARFIAECIKKAIEEFNKTKQMIKQNQNYLNNSWNIPYVDIDYTTLSLIKNQKIYKLNTNIENEPSKTHWTIREIRELSKMLEKAHLNNNSLYQSRPDFLHFAGYGLTDFNRLLVTLFKSVPYGQEDNKEAIYNGNLSKFFKVDTSFHGKHVVDSILFNEISPVTYGAWYHYYIDHKTVGGVSGSLVINQEGLPIGVVFGVGTNIISILNDENRFVTLHPWSITPFSLTAPFYNPENGLNAYPYNLIDNSNKVIYPKQKTSYRSKLYEVFGNDYRTSLFE